jgi:hypothetical protein
MEERSIIYGEFSPAGPEPGTGTLTIQLPIGGYYLDWACHRNGNIFYFTTK